MLKKLLYFGLAVIFLFAVVLVSVTPRLEFELLLSELFFAFSVWFLLLRERVNVTLLLILAVAARFVFFWELPLLSDDFYRFIWDGQLLLDGINPIGKIPSEVQVEIANKALLLREMNSAQYPSVYPPFHQLAMAFGALFDGFLNQVNGMRLVIIFCESLGLIYFFRFAKSLLPIYAAYLINPLVVVEGVGNVHFEAALMPFLAIALHSATRNEKFKTSFSYATAILIKLNPLVLMPALLKERKSFKTVLFTLGLVVLGFLPFVSGMVDSIEGFGLFFRTFEFNASVYYFLSEIGKMLLGYNPISVLGPLLAVFALLLILRVGLSKMELNDKALLTYLIFLLLSSTVHPWYIIPVVYFSLIAKRQLILIWSFTAFFSYSHYLGIIEPKYGWILAEYAMLFTAMIYEYRRRPIQLFRG